MAYQLICTVAELPAAGNMREVSVGGRQLCLANDGGRYAAVDALCPHRGAPLAEGTIEAGRIICPWHAWGFDLMDGRAEHDPSELVRVYRLRIDAESVLAELPD